MELFDRRVIREGIIAGLIGAGVVAVWFLAFDLIEGMPFHTPALLWAIVFQGLRDPQALQITPGAVIGYSVVHVLAFSAFGILCAKLIARAGPETALLLASFSLFACFQLFFLGLAGLIARMLTGALFWWEIFVANLLASVAMVAYFFVGHRALGYSVLATLRRLIREGVVAGLIGAVGVAAWFLIFDTATGQPLRTPGFLGAVVFEGLTDPQALEISVAVVLAYTILHILAFVAFGILCAILISASEQEPALLWAFVALFACFEVFFFALIGLLGHSVVGVLVWWAILVGNLLASGGMLGYFFIGHRALGRTLLGPWAGVVREGIIAGLMGAGTVAVWFLSYDTFRGHPLRTPTLLGAYVFGTMVEPQAVAVDLPTVLGYTVLHVGGFIFFGVIAAFLIVAAERQPILLLGLFILFSAFEVFFFGLLRIFAQSLLGEIVWWTIFVGNLLASLAMLAYFFSRHRALGKRLIETWPAEET